MTVLQEVMQHSGVTFGTSGARGLVSAMTDSVCASYTDAFIQTMRQSFEFEMVAIAVDLRPSSLKIAEACVKMLRQNGLQVIFCGEIPTPALALYAQNKRIPAIMVTGSHIPFDRNGLKFYRPDSEITKADEFAMLQTTVSDLKWAEAAALTTDNASAREAYMERYILLVEHMLGPMGFSGLKLALYQHSSVARDILHTLLQKLGAEVICLERSDSFVPIDTEAVSEEDKARGLAWSGHYKTDAIISTDGDGDRPLIADEHGNWLRGDIVGLLTAKVLSISHLAVPVSCNTAIELSGYFEQVVRTPIGSPFVIAGMQALQKQGAIRVAGFEANGGFLLGNRLSELQALEQLPTRDAVLPIIAILIQVQLMHQSISKIVSELPPRYTASNRLQQFSTSKSQQLLKDWQSNAIGFQQLFNPQAQIRDWDTTDGLRVSWTNGQVTHFRPSGNAPEFRCYVEDSTPESAEALLNRLMLILESQRL